MAVVPAATGLLPTKVTLGLVTSGVVGDEPASARTEATGSRTRSSSAARLLTPNPRSSRPGGKATPEPPRAPREYHPDPVTSRCGRCGEENRVGAKFCQECGAPLTSV